MLEPKRAVFPLLVIFSLSACSVLEDRDSCPCTLGFVTASDVGCVHLLLDAGNGFLWEESVEDLGGSLFQVPREMLRCCIVQGAEPGPEGSVIIPEGEDCPEIRMHRSVIDARCAAVTDTVEFHKSYCVMDICLEGREAFGLRNLEVKSSTAGYDRYGESVEGVFRHSPSRLRDGTYRLRLPRQLSPDLEIEAEFLSGGGAVFPLGAYLDDMDYDWNAEDLGDVVIRIDSRSSSVRIITSCWQKSFSFDLRI
jgi:hypothetical protein